MRKRQILIEQTGLELANIEESFAPGQVLGEAKVDRQSSLLSNVTLLGKTSANGRIYSDRAMNDAVRLYEGVSFYIDHPTDRELRDRKGVRSVRDLAGRIKNPRRVGEMVRGDIELLNNSGLKDLVFAIAEQMPEKAGNSHRASGSVKNENGKQIVESLDKVFAVELVTDPATTNGLFESSDNGVEKMDFKSITIESLKSERPDLVKAVLAESKDQAEVERLKAENADLKKKSDLAEAKEKERAHKDMVAKKLEEAKLPKRLVTDLFTEQLNAAEDEQTVDALIADRKEVAKGLKESGPRSTERNLDESLQDKNGETTPIDESKLGEYAVRLGVVS